MKTVSAVAENHPFVGLQLRTGETVLTELVGVDEEFVTIAAPIKLSIDTTEDSSYKFSGVPYAAYSSSKEHRLSVNHIVMMDRMSERFVKFYGNVIMNIELSELRNNAYSTMRGNVKEDYYELISLIDSMKIIANSYHDKFGIDSPDFSEMESHVRENGPVLN
jgi:hypothetical protein